MADVIEIIVQDGIPGPQGPQGPQGETGMDGLSAYEIWLAEGNTGTDQDFLNSLIGPQGPQGEQGAQGIQGEKGDKGDPGNDGEQGTPGAPGADGASAYEVAVDNGFIGTEAQWLASLKGDPGEKGDKGDKGDPGTTDYNNLDNVPATFPPSPHTHNADDIDSGTLGEERIPVLAISKITGLQDEINEKLAVGSGTQDATTYRRGDGTWATPPNTTYAVLSQANAQSPASTVTGLASGAVLAQAIEGRIVLVSANKTLAITDRLTYQRVTAASTVTIPTNGSVPFPIGTKIDFFQADDGAITFAASGGVTINSYGDILVTDGKGAAASLKKVGTNEWDLII